MMKPMSSTLDQARALFVLGNDLYAQQKFSQAKQAYQQALVLVPGRPSLLANLGMCFFRLDDWPSARAPLEQALAAEGLHEDARLALGLIFERDGAWNQAVQVLASLATHPTLGSRALATMAGCAARLNLPDQAIHYWQQLIALQPRHALAHSAMGNLLREAGQLEQAAASYLKALECGADKALHDYYLAAVTNAQPPPAPPAQYAQLLFDQYADEFAAHLVDQLGYQVPRRLLGPFIVQGLHFERVLDLGCGTGLCGQVLAGHVKKMVGVDISAKMVSIARASEFYDQVEQAELLPFLNRYADPVDLIVAADVFIYVGWLEEVFAQCARLLKPAGLLAFSVEQPPQDVPVQLLPSLRYAHGLGYLKGLAQTYGFSWQHEEQAVLRNELGKPIVGRYITLRKSPH
jgi:predicted TPR repeat methyltransferase